MDSRRDDITTELRNNEEEIIAFFKGLNSGQLGMTVYPEDPGWTVQQILAHFITIEGTMQWLFKDILAGGPGSPEDFDVDVSTEPSLESWTHCRSMNCSINSAPCAGIRLRLSKGWKIKTWIAKAGTPSTDTANWSDLSSGHMNTPVYIWMIFKKYCNKLSTVLTLSNTIICIGGSHNDSTGTVRKSMVCHYAIQQEEGGQSSLCIWGFIG